MRKHTLAECNAQFAIEREGGSACWVLFDCPEGHEGCRRAIPFSPAIDGSTPEHKSGGVVWQRTGGDTPETLTLSPSIRGLPRYANRDAAIADGCIPEHIVPSLFCAVHIFIRNGRIEFCGDSR